MSSQPPGKQVTLHPILFALYPAVSLFGSSYYFFDPPVVIRAALVCASLSAVLWWLLTRFLGDSKRAAIPVSVLFVAVFSFRVVHDAIVSGVDGFGSQKLVVLVCVGLSALGILAFFKFEGHAEQITYAMNLVGIVLFMMPVAGFGMGRLLAWNVPVLFPDRTAFWAAAEQPIQAASTPDIYCIVLDGYGRQDMLQELYDFDNSGMTDFLRDRGFFVADESSSNYPQTLLSIGSILNFAYIDEVVGNDLAELQDRRYLRSLLRRSRAAKILRRAGYRSVAFASHFYDAEIADVDRYVTRWWFPSFFELSLLDTTPAPWLLDKLGTPILYDLHRSRILYAFDQLERIHAEPGPKFVYMHVFAGHPPFVLGPNGEPRAADRPYRWDEGETFVSNPGASREEYHQGYRDQISYLNRRVQSAIDQILEHSESTPVILIQGDHGPGSGLSGSSLERTDVFERYSILNAYLLPGAAESQLYPSISPVNSFRVILNRYFGQQLPLLEDRSYFTPAALPYAFTEVPRDRLLAAAQNRFRATPSTRRYDRPTGDVVK